MRHPEAEGTEPFIAHVFAEAQYSRFTYTGILSHNQNALLNCGGQICDHVVRHFSFAFRQQIILLSDHTDAVFHFVSRPLVIIPSAA